MWFSHLGKLGQLQCSNTIEISADPNCFILSKIISELWCPNKCRKLKLIPYLCSAMISAVVPQQKNKHLPLIKYPPGQRESVCLLQPISHPTPPPHAPPVLTDSAQYLPLGKKRKQNRKREESSRRKAILYHCWNCCLRSTLLCDRAVQ